MALNKRCSCFGQNLNKWLEPSIMGHLAKADLHGYEIVKLLAEMDHMENQSPDNSGVYRLLKKLESQKYVKARWRPGNSGPAQRCYSLTPSGRACLKQWCKTLDQYLVHLQVLNKEIQEMASQ